MASATYSTPAMEYPSVVDRYFTKLYPRDYPDLCLLLHSNGIVLVTLSENHQLIKCRSTVITSVDYQVTNKLNRQDNKVVGKGKRGAQVIMPESILCRIKSADGTEFRVRGCIKGKLVEMNERLVDSPEVLNQSGSNPAYIAILLVEKTQVKRLKELYNLAESPILNSSTSETV